MKKRGLLHHVELYVADLDETMNFWSWFLSDLGYHQHRCWDQGESWKLGETYICFVQVKEKYKDLSYNRSGVGVNHLAFWAESQMEVNLITKKVKEHGLPILYQDRHPYAAGKDIYAVYFEDPNRIKIEVVAKE